MFVFIRCDVHGVGLRISLDFLPVPGASYKATEGKMLILFLAASTFSKDLTKERLVGMARVLKAGGRGPSVRYE
jgi:hypothetical protein